jgi:hypothetical protein
MELLKTTGLTLTTLIFTALLSLTTQAADIAGHIIMVKGDVSAATSDGNQRALKRRDPVFVSDTITTGDSSRVQIRFIDNGLLALQANSQLAIHSYNQNADAPEQEKVLMELVEGGFRTLTGTIGKGNKEAYQVDTPVASIGIRGTLYSALVSQGQLFAGVWKGGIRLSNDSGSYDLGMGADYAFGSVGSHGFTGMMTPPDELGDSPTEGSDQGTDDAGVDGNEGPQDETPDSAAGTGSEQREEGNLVPNPLDQDDDGNTLESLKEQGLVDDPDDDNTGNGNGDPEPPVDIATRISPDVRLSDDEYTSLLTSTEAGILLTENGTQTAAVIRDANDQPVFLVVDGEGVDITRFSYADTAAEVLVPAGVGDVEWGIWNGSAATPVEQYLTDDSNEVTTVETPVFWLAAEPIQETVVAAMTGSVSFSGSEALGTNSEGDQILYSSGSFDLDFSSGLISNGNISLSYGTAPESLTTDWYAEFDGSIRGNGATNTPNVSMNLTYGYLTNPMTESMSELDLVNSKLGGFLTGATALQAFVGAYHFRTIDAVGTGVVQTADGLIAWPLSLIGSITDLPQ